MVSEPPLPLILSAPALPSKTLSLSSPIRISSLRVPIALWTESTPTMTSPSRTEFPFPPMT